MSSTLFFHIGGTKIQDESKYSIIFYIGVKWYEKTSSIDNSHSTLIYANDSNKAQHIFMIL